MISGLSNKIKPWRVTRAARYLKNGKLSPTYKVETHEVNRIDYQTLQCIMPRKFVNFNSWEKNLVINKTHHATEERLKQYLNRPVTTSFSRSSSSSQRYDADDGGDGGDSGVNTEKSTATNISNNGDVEITPEEFDYINTVSLETFVHNWEAKLVELGFNKYNEICKAAYVLQLPSSRFLFFCVGMDNGLKTLYITPKFKHRDSYHGCSYLNMEEAMQM